MQINGLVALDMDGIWMTRFVNSRSPLLQNIVDIHQILLCCEIRECVVLRQGTRSTRHRGDGRHWCVNSRGCRCHVRTGHRASHRNSAHAMQGQERSADLLVVCWNDGSSLHAAKKVIQVVKTALLASGISIGGWVSDIITTAGGSIGTLRCRHEQIVARSLGGAAIVVSRPRLGREGRSVSPHVAMLLIVAIGRS